MKKYMMTAMIVFSTMASAMAQFDNQGYANNDDRYYYDNEFDWHWDIRVRVSDGVQRGLITRYESDLLYRRLENLEQKEYAYQSDGIFSGWEQQEIWNDVVYLNQRLGLELSDYDRNFYGFDVYGYDRRGYSKWYYQGGYDFFRFDKRGFGNIRLGYYPRSNYNGWYRNHDNRIAQRYCNDRGQYANRGDFRRGNDRYDRDRRGGYNQYPNNSKRGGYEQNRGRGYGNNGNPQGNGNRNNGPFNGGERNNSKQIEIPDNIEPNRPVEVPQGSRSDRPNFEPNRADRSVETPSQGSRSDRPNFETNRADRNDNPSQGNRQDRPIAQPNVGNDNNKSGGNDWNVNRGGVKSERPSGGRRGND